MIDNQGQFFSDVGRECQLSEPILRVGVQKTLQQVEFEPEKFARRGGFYAWGQELLPAAAEGSVQGDLRS